MYLAPKQKLQIQTKGRHERHYPPIAVNRRESEYPPELCC